MQLAATVIHELAHVMAGPKAGHGFLWKAAAHALGLPRAAAVGWDGLPDNFEPEVLASLLALGTPEDGQPTFATNGKRDRRPCPGGIGTRGGDSRGPGSGSRLRLFECACQPPVKARVGRNEFHAQCMDCGCAFKRTITNKEKPQ